MLCKHVAIIFQCNMEIYVLGPRRSIIVSDKRLPPGWEKHFTQRKAGTSAGKWDVLFIQ